MNPQRWQQVRDVLHQAMQLEPEERPAYLDRWCVDDEDLRKEVRELLNVEQDLATGFLESLPEAEAVLDRLSVLAAHEGGLPSNSEPLIGRCFGSYLIVEKIGAGGMGDRKSVV